MVAALDVIGFKTSATTAMNADWFEELKDRVPTELRWKHPRRHFGGHSFPNPE